MSPRCRALRTVPVVLTVCIAGQDRVVTATGNGTVGSSGIGAKRNDVLIVGRENLKTH
jgi:hypothetical protein